MSISGARLKEDHSQAVYPSGSVDVRQLQSGEEDSWDAFVQSAESGTLFHLSSWARVVEREFNRKSCALVAWRGKQISGVFPLSLVRSRLFGNSLVSSPLAVYGGICAADRESHDSLLRAGS